MLGLFRAIVALAEALKLPDPHISGTPPPVLRGYTAELIEYVTVLLKDWKVELPLEQRLYDETQLPPDCV
jgi:hypothetical protein